MKTNKLLASDRDQRKARAATLWTPLVKLTDPHPLVQTSYPILESAASDDTGRLRATEAECLDIRVSPVNLARALLIMDALVKSLNAIDCDVLVSEGRTKVRLGDISIAVALSEEVVRKHLRAKDHDLEGYYAFGYGLYEKKPSPTGALCLSIEDTTTYPDPSYRTNWRDVGSRRLEACLASFVSGLLKAAAVQRVIRRRDQEKGQGSPE